MLEGIYYLGSLDSTRFEPARKCRFERLLTLDFGKAAAEARLTPGIIGQDFNRSSVIEAVILTSRHEGDPIDSITQFPYFVHIAIPRIGFATLESPIRADDVEIIGHGELYKTRGDARHWTF